MGYLLCEKCGGYYKLQPGESPEEFGDKCECGGVLKYVDTLESIDTKKMEEMKSTITCPRCGTENPEDAKLCKSCKRFLKPIKTPPTFETSQNTSRVGLFGDLFEKWSEKSTPIKVGSIIGVIGVCCLGLILIVGLMGFISPDAAPLTGAALAQYKASCQNISFGDLDKDPDKYQGQHVQFTGEIVQIMESNGKTVMRLAVTKDSYGYSFTDIIYVVYDNATPFVENNIVTVYGDVYGSYSYTSEIGAQISLPRINARYIEKVSDQYVAPSTATPSQSTSPSAPNYNPPNQPTPNYTAPSNNSAAIPTQ